MVSDPGMLLDHILTIYWIIITAVYLVISFKTGRWVMTWIIFVIASIPALILELVFKQMDEVTVGVI